MDLDIVGHNICTTTKKIVSNINIANLEKIIEPGDMISLVLKFSNSWFLTDKKLYGTKLEISRIEIIKNKKINEVDEKILNNYLDKYNKLILLKDEEQHSD
jgi:hypothetical protein